MATNPANFPLPQTTYTQFPQAGYDGMLADLGQKDIWSCLVQTAIAAGMGACSGTDFGQIIPPTTGTDVTAHFQGIVILDVMREPNGYPTPSVNRYAQYATVSVLRRGRIWVMGEHDLTTDAAVYCVTTAASGYTLGRFQAAATNASLVPNCVCLQGQTAASGKPSLIEINLT